MPVRKGGDVVWRTYRVQVRVAGAPASTLELSVDNQYHQTQAAAGLSSAVGNWQQLAGENGDAQALGAPHPPK
jgi:hypothetical protein